MADWFNTEIGKFCEKIQKEINENPALMPWAKKEFVEMLEDCAKKAPQDKSAFNRSFRELSKTYERQTGQRFSREHVS